ncbi:MAG: CSLREA domain-containing protein, partial [Actinobacteria bacterium]
MRGTRPARTTARLVMLALLALFPFASVARAATTITVTTTKDELDVDGKCSLREA